MRGEMERYAFRDYDIREVSVCGGRGVGEGDGRKTAFDIHWFIED